MRKMYMDNIRSGVVILVLIYHVFYLFNNAGVPGGIGGEPGVKAFDALLYFVYPWFMALLFLIAGMSTRYSLQKRSAKQFLKERVTKLLIPSTLGLFVYHWIGGYMNIKMGGGLEFIPAPLVYPVAVVAGIGPLWFIQALFLFSLLAVLLRRLDANDFLWKLGGKAHIIIVLLMVVPVWGAAQVLNTPVITMYRFGIYGFMFLLGYFVFSHDEIQEAVAKIRVPLLILAVGLGVAYVAYYFGGDYTSPQCLQSLFTNVYLWAAVLAVMGCGKAWLNKEWKYSKPLARSSFGLYIVHYPVVLALCLLLHHVLGLPPVLNYGVALGGEFVLTFLIYELFKRIPLVRYLVLGISKKKLPMVGTVQP